MPTSFERLKTALADRYEIEREVGRGADYPEGDDYTLIEYFKVST